jgi:type IV pilus assembly protein PilQ
MRVFDSRKLLPVSVFLLISTLAVSGATSRETAVVKDLSFNPSGATLEVKIATTEQADYTYFELSKPRRLVVDFHGIQNGIGFKEKSIEAAGVERVRTSYFSDKNRNATRIVFDILENVSYQVVNDGEGIVRVVFDGAAPQKLEKPAPPSPSLPHRLLEPVISPLERVPVTLTAGPPMVVEAPTKSLPAGSLLIPTTRQTPPAQLPASLSPGQTPQQYTGEITSFDLKDIDLKDFFRLIANMSGLNIVLDPAVSGTVTLSLTDVPWDQALDIVLKNNNLGSQLQGNVLRIANNATLANEEAARKAFREAQELNVDLVTKSYLLNYTKSESVSATLTKLLSPRGTIIQDPRRNALIVSDIPNQFAKIDQLVQFLDTPSPQVEIEARLVSATKGFSRDLGSQLGVVFGNNSQNSISGAPIVGASPFNRTPAPNVHVGQAIPLNVNLPAAATSGVSFLLGAGADIILDEIITAAEARGTAKTISRPKVMTQNNLAALVQQGTQIPVQTNQNNTVSVQFLTFSLQLSVTPQITDVGTILLAVQIENSTPDFGRSVNGIPSVSTQRAQTNVLVPDGGTAVLGGILLDQDTLNIFQVPGFGSIPLIGNLFKRTQTIKSTAELLFFVTPRIKPADSINAVPGAVPPPPGRDR